MKPESFREILEKCLDEKSHSFSHSPSENEIFFEPVVSFSTFVEPNLTVEQMNHLQNLNFTTLNSKAAQQKIFKEYQRQTHSTQDSQSYFQHNNQSKKTNSSHTEDVTTKHQRNSLPELEFKAYEKLFYALEMPVLEANRLFPMKFTLPQLKKAFRKVALKNHPDTGGCHETFIELKKCYEILLQFVTTQP